LAQRLSDEPSAVVLLGISLLANDCRGAIVVLAISFDSIHRNRVKNHEVPLRDELEDEQNEQPGTAVRDKLLPQLRNKISGTICSLYPRSRLCPWSARW
jgi:hypothetical protein